MNLPPWSSDDPQDQQALSRFIIGELEKADAARATSATMDKSKVRYLQTVAELRQQAGRIGLTVPLPQPPKRPGPKRDPHEFTAFDWAELDVLRIRALFMRHYGKRNRLNRPLAEEIAAERWELSKADRAALIDKFAKKGRKA